MQGAREGFISMCSAIQCMLIRQKQLVQPAARTSQGSTLQNETGRLGSGSQEEVAAVLVWETFDLVMRAMSGNEGMPWEKQSHQNALLLGGSELLLEAAHSYRCNVDR